MLYFDHNATHPISATAKRVWLEAVEKFPANASSPHRLGQRAETALNDARGRLAKLLGCSAEEIVFTSGATESANTVLAQFDEKLVSAIEHPCVIEPSCGVDRLFLALLVSAYRYDMYGTNIMPDTVEYVDIHLKYWYC